MYALKLSIKIYYINIRASKIDSFILKTFSIIIANFQIEDKHEKF